MHPVGVPSLRIAFVFHLFAHFTSSAVIRRKSAPNDLTTPFTHLPGAASPLSLSSTTAVTATSAVPTIMSANRRATPTSGLLTLSPTFSGSIDTPLASVFAGTISPTSDSRPQRSGASPQCVNLTNWFISTQQG
ncbi:hypothetical protein B0H19DRAFT_322257 [Mycena capillaripes]|nr:hypothetical protein B0H19DRAFT_322257 [Mycena capillaripes]